MPGGGLDLLVGDLGFAELLAGGQDVHGVDHSGVGPLIGTERERGGRLLGGQVGVDVAATEGVDGLLGVAHQDERGAGPGTEERLEDLPLDGVGVLELVDERDVELGAHFGRHGGRGDEGVTHLGQE